MTSTDAGEQIAHHVFAFTGTETNWVIIEDHDELTLIDAGWPGDVQAVERSIRSLGRRPEDLRAVLLTHAHADHTGALNHLHDSYGTLICTSAAEVPNARGEDVETAGPIDVARRLYRPQVVRWASQMIKAGSLHPAATPSAQAFGSEHPLDLPGRPVPVATPGHTSGHTSYLIPDAGLVVTGDALVSAHPTLPRRGPQLLPAEYAHDQRGVIASLAVLRDLDADAFIPGHGPAWYGSMADAVDQALDRVRSR